MTRFSKLSFTLFFGGALALSSAAQSSPDSTGTKASAAMTAADSTFLKHAAAGGMAEVELGQLASEKASNPEVKLFGQRMVDDHSKANDQLRQVAAQEHVSLPRGPSAKDKITKTNLEKLSGDQFDRAYMEDMVQDHKKDVADFERESKTAHDPAIKSFATQTLPTLREHLKEAQKIAPTQQAKAQ
jgi:putative membrane protein